MNREEFERVVAKALDGLPTEVAAFLENVAVVVEDEPTEEDLVEAGLDPETDTLFGIYQGLALPDRGGSYGNVLPDRIVIYRRPLLEECDDRNELIREIQDTVVHEIGHYFGLGEGDLP
ncbi:MAG: metallopeptidase family protein [Thermoanaerobaculaceae bacterium]|jgi:predicted Zn-dependent protease with MMP-like domain|nr:metallopeptidase family protein [Thermoanaerobaculaceae bacterium]